ncbi:DUF169 domain-containing protein [Methanoregula sp.]|uniref:DUF169 domain-containing protein n=1 Tax=Methanoregula sp. TaxID=2052170 RepID=UPI00236E3A52|nr:DUF169 domain-containing protein [Methanoregula sp.]MDD1687586.1 DUF169 domain-containing protein [Methanoregula sp.]
MLPRSEIARAAGIMMNPVAIVWTDTKPENALAFKPGVWGCVMWLFAKVAKEGKTAVFSRDTTTCAGGAMGLGFGRPLERHAARSEEGFCSFLSNGIGGAANRKAYDAIIAQAPDERHRTMLTEGERFLKNPGTVRNFLLNLPIYDAKDRYIVMKPVHDVGDGEEVKSVVFVANADQIAALSILANYGTGNIRDGIVVTAGASGCQAMGVCTYAEGESRSPRAVIGLTDLSARRAVRPTLGKNILTFSVPFAVYREMEKNVPGSFLELDLWKELRDSG